MKATKALAAFIKEKGIKISMIAKKTGLSENVLYTSLGSGRDRELRANEFLAICVCLAVDPLQFYTAPENQED